MFIHILLGISRYQTDIAMLHYAKKPHYLQKNVAVNGLHIVSYLQVYLEDYT